MRYHQSLRKCFLSSLIDFYCCWNEPTKVFFDLRFASAIFKKIEVSMEMYQTPEISPSNFKCLITPVVQREVLNQNPPTISLCIQKSAVC